MGKSLPPPPFFSIVLNGSPLCISVVSERGDFCLTLSLYLFTLSAFILEFFLNINILHVHFLIQGKKGNVQLKSPSTSSVALILGKTIHSGLYGLEFHSFQECVF